MKLLSTITVRVAFLNLAAFPGFLVLTDDNSKVKTSKYSGVHLNKINFNDDSFKEFSPDSLNPGNEISFRLLRFVWNLEFTGIRLL